MSEDETFYSDSSDSDDQAPTGKMPDGKPLTWHGTGMEVELSSNISSNERPPSPPPISKDPPEEINILLLGESGVGKSTFINSFANYMKHASFEEVRKNDLEVLIPARFHIFDRELKKHLIELGAKDKNEYLADGAAATQDVKTYVFYIAIERKNYKIRLIDTPGMGDPRGIDQDNKNCDYVLNYIGRLQKIHAICLLLKPTNTRLDVFLNYCVTQILSRLEKSATENIAFLFTNTRGQNYTPGDTYISLELLVQKIKDTNNVSLPLSNTNVFCFDNEAFRFLASIKRGVQFKDGILEANIESWKYSYKEIYRLLSYIVNLPPHDPKKTISINHARKMVLQLSQPLAEIVQLIGDNLYKLDQHTHQLLMENQSVEDLKKKLHMPVIDILVKELPRPVTVCTAPKCSITYKVADKNKYHYKQRCHNPCHLNNVPREIVGDPHLLDCWAMNKSTQTCHQCGCRFNTHMHIYYETETFENKIVDENVLRNINSKEEAAKEKERIINNICDHKEQLEKEHKYIIKCSAAFAHFLQENAITPINDSLKEYVKYLITREENLGPQANKSTMDYLRRLLSEYEQERSVLKEALKHNAASNSIQDCSPSSIENKIKELFRLNNFGKKIKQLYDLHHIGSIVEHEQSEHVVQQQYSLSVLQFTKNCISRGMEKLGIGGGKKKNKKIQQQLEENQKPVPYDNGQVQKQIQQFERKSQDYRGYNNGHQFAGPYFGPHSKNNPNYWKDSYYGWEEHLLPTEHQRRQQFAMNSKYYNRFSNDDFSNFSYGPMVSKHYYENEKAKSKVKEPKQKNSSNGQHDKKHDVLNGNEKGNGKKAGKNNDNECQKNKSKVKNASDDEWEDICKKGRRKNKKKNKSGRKLWKY